MKDQRFWALARLSLCFLSCFLLCSCTIYSKGKITDKPTKSYILTIKMQLNENDTNLISLLEEAGLFPEMLNYTDTNELTDNSKCLSVKIHFNNQSQWQMVESRLRNSDSKIQNMQIRVE